MFENVALAVRIAGFFGDSEVIPRTLRALDEVGLRHHQTSLPSELSFGERQRCAIARAIVNRPAVLSPTSPRARSRRAARTRCSTLLRRIHHEGAALIVGTTRPEVADALGGRRLVLEEGRLREASPESAFLHPGAPAWAAPEHWSDAGEELSVHLFFFREAWRSFNAHRGLALTAIFSMTAALTLCGVFLLFATTRARRCARWATAARWSST